MTANLPRVWAGGYKMLVSKLTDRIDIHGDVAYE